MAGGLGFAAAFVVACGGSNDLLSGDQSGTLSTQLEAVSAAVNSGNCTAASRAADKFNSEVGDLNSPVSSKLVQSLGDGAVKLKALAAKDCSSSSSSSSSSPTSSSSSSTSTTTTTITKTSTTPSSSTQATEPTSATNPPTPGTSSSTVGGAPLGTGTNGGTGNGGQNSQGQ
jgi:hypothetical protein